jgi:hypothetical protein
MAMLSPRTPSLSEDDFDALGAAFGLRVAEADQFTRVPGPLLTLEWMALTCAFAALMVGAAVIVRRWRNEPARLLPLLWGLVPTLGLLLVGRPSLHVAVTSSPAVALVIAIGLVIPATEWRTAPRHLARAAIIVLVLAQAASIVGQMRGAAEQGSGTTAPLETWANLAAEAVDAAERTGATELLVLPVQGPFEAGSDVLGSLLGPRLALRALPTGVVPLPVERDALYLLLPGASEASALVRPSARHAAVALPGTSEPVRLVSLRPRPAHQWLADDNQSAMAPFADGTYVLLPSVR